MNLYFKLKNIEFIIKIVFLIIATIIFIWLALKGE